MEHVLLVIDMQKVSERKEWHVENIENVTENVLSLCNVFKGNTIFTRHLANPNAKGTWKNYNRDFSYLEKDPTNWELIEKLKPYAEKVIDKHTYSCYKSAEFNAYYRKMGHPDFIIAGVETDFCVLSTLFDLVDDGCPVTLAVDAVGTATQSLNNSVIDICRRMPAQVTLKTTNEIINELR